MTRVFISLVESGKCNPSPDTLRIIAQRLGKPTSYFLGEGDTSDDVLAGALLSSAQRDLETGCPDPKQLEATEHKVKAALSQLTGAADWEMLVRAHMLLARCYRLQNRMEESLMAYEQALEGYKELKSPKGLAEVYKAIGDISYANQEFLRAQNAYKQAVLYSTGLKSMVSLKVDALTFLGTTLYRMGALDEALTAYYEALADCKSTEASGRWGVITMGVGWTLYVKGNLSGAADWTRRALEFFKRDKGENYTLAKHNLAIIELGRGNWETAYVTLQECLASYKARGRLVKQASVLDDLAQYWLHKGNIAQAEATCWEAIEVLDSAESTVLRGRLYRTLGILAAIQGNEKQAHTLLRVSIDLLQRIKATLEAARSREALQRLQSGDWEWLISSLLPTVAARREN